jgi:hypothetical protein
VRHSAGAEGLEGDVVADVEDGEVAVGGVEDAGEAAAFEEWPEAEPDPPEEPVEPVDPHAVRVPASTAATTNDARRIPSVSRGRGRIAVIRVVWRVGSRVGVSIRP